MKIIKVETIPLNIPTARPHGLSFGALTSINYVIVKIHTDGGQVGLGEAATLGGPTWSEESQETIKATIDNYLAKLILGEDPFRVEWMLKKMDKGVKGNLFAKAAIEMGLFDIVGKSLGVPVYQLLGGLCHEKVPLSWSLATMNPKQEAEEAVERVEKGWGILKLKVGMKSIDEDVLRVKTVREAVGDRVKIRVDANQGWDYVTARKAIAAMEEYGIEFVEQPVPRWNMNGMARVAKAINVPVMADESLCTMRDAITIVKKEAADIFALKLTKSGGLLNSKGIASVAEAYGIGCYVGSMIETGIGTAAYLHCATSTSNLSYGCELWGPLMIKDDIVTESIKYERGHIVALKKPGLGIELDEDNVRKYSVAC
jgi:muconate cycloisomerase